MRIGARARSHVGMQLPRALDFPKRVVLQTLDDDVLELAAGLAYRFLFAVFPFGIFLAALGAFVAQWIGVGDPTDEILSAIGDNLPPDVAEQIAPQLQTVLGVARPGLLSIGAIAALWAATGGVSSLIGAMNKAYDVKETRNFFVKLALAFALTLVGSAGIIIAFVTVVGGSILTEQAVKAIGIEGGTWSILSLLRFPVVLLLVALAVGALFHFGPNVRVSFRWTFIGGIVFAVGWLLATGIFGLYVANFGSYANTYGALGGVIVLMLWFYLTALLLLVAAEVTSILAKDHDSERLEARRTETAATAIARGAGKRAARKAGVVAGGAATAAQRGGAEDVGLDDRPRARETEPEPSPITRIQRDDADDGPRTEFRPSRLAAVAILAAGAAAGAIAGLLAGNDDETTTPSPRR